MERPRIAISMGDPNGIGPEVSIKCLLRPGVRDRVDAVLVGDEAVLWHHARVLGLDALPAPVVQVNAAERFTPVCFGHVTAAGGELSMQAVAKAVDLCLEGDCQAMVTAPISKEAIGAAGYSEPGHTEYLARLTSSPDHLMMMVAGGLRVGLVTGHLPISQVAAGVTRSAVRTRLERQFASLSQDFGIEHPRVAVLGLNPHAGDGGVLGDEEQRVITPAMTEAQGGTAEGPFPADGFFAEERWKDYDAVLAMYHDQGLIPFKTLAFDTGVNFTAGLPIVRTSPDHGTAYDIAGRGIAREESMYNALEVALEVVQSRTSQISTAR